MGHDRMRSLMIGNIHRNLLKEIQLEIIMKNFIEANKQRKLTFAVPEV